MMATVDSETLETRTMEKVKPITLIINGNAFRLMEHPEGGDLVSLWTGPVYEDGRVSESLDEWTPICPYEDWTDADEAIYTALRQLESVRM